MSSAPRLKESIKTPVSGFLVPRCLNVKAGAFHVHVKEGDTTISEMFIGEIQIRMQGGNILQNFQSILSLAAVLKIAST